MQQDIYYLRLRSLRVAQMRRFGSWSLTRLQSRCQQKSDGDQIIRFEDDSFIWLLAGGLSPLPCGKGHKKGHVFHASIYIEFLEITKLYRQKALHRSPRVWNKNRNDVQKGTMDLLGWKFVIMVAQQCTFPKTCQTVHLKWINLRYVNCASINLLKHQSI